MGEQLNKPTRRRPPTAWRIVGWEKYEPEPSSRVGYEQTPPAYVREWINADGSHLRRTTRMEIDQERHAILAAGGPALYGIFRLLVGYAADRGCLRGWLLDYRGRPASPKTIARELGLSAHELRHAMRLLASPTLGLLARAALPTQQQREERPGERPGPKAERQPLQAPHAAPERPRPAPSAGDDVESSTPAQPARASPDGESATFAAAEPTTGGNINSNGVSLAADGRNGCACKKKKNGNECVKTNEGGSTWPRGGNDNDKPEGQAATPGRNSQPPPTETASGEASTAASPPRPSRPAGQERGTPAAGRSRPRHGSGEETPTETASGEAGRHGRSPSPARPADTAMEMECEMDADLWQALAEAGDWRTSWQQIWADRRGGQFAKAVYYCLRLPRRVSSRQFKREMIPFANAWRVASQSGLPVGPLLRLAEASLRHALHLGEHPPKPDPTAIDKPGNRSRVWLSQFKRRRERTVRDWLRAM